MQIPPGFMAIFARYTTGSGHACQNVMGYSVSGPPTQADIDLWSAAITDAHRDFASSATVVHGIHVLVGQDGDPLAFDSASGAGNGANSGDLAPPQVQGLIKKTTALGGRHGRGRMFIPDIREAAVNDSGGLTGGTVTALTQLGTVYLDLDVVGASVDIAPVLLHEDSTTPTPVLSMLGQAKAATLRRRYDR